MFYGQADRERLPPFPAWSVFVCFLGFVFYLRLWLCSEMDFTPEKSFLSNYKNFQLCSVTKRSDSSIAEALKVSKNIFETPHKEIKCVLSIRVIFHWKNGSIFFTFTYGQGWGGWPPPPLTVSLTVKYLLLLWLPLRFGSFKRWVTLENIGLCSYQQGQAMSRLGSMKISKYLY